VRGKNLAFVERSWSTILQSGSFTAAMAILGISAIARIPLAARAVGSSCYGEVLTVGGAIPILLAPLAGLRGATRARAFLAGEKPTSYPSLAAALRVSRRWVVVNILLASIGIRVLWNIGRLPSCPATSDFSARSMMISLFALAAVAIPCGSLWGEEEARGRAHVFNVHVGLAAIAGLILVVFANSGREAVALVFLGTNLTSIAPYLSMGAWSLLRPFPRDPQQERSIDPERSTPIRTAGFTSRAYADAFVRGSDPLVVGLILGGRAAAGYNTIMRFSQLLIAPQGGLATYYSRRIARMSRSGDARSILPGMRRLAAFAGLGGLCAGLLLLLVGTPLTSRLLGHQVEAPRSLLLVFALLMPALCIHFVVGLAVASSEFAFRLLPVVVGVALANISLSVLLTKSIGAIGAAVASLISVSLEVVIVSSYIKVRTRERIEQSGTGVYPAFWEAT
jgi:O-antigen/teichoic acid export membrane protein